MASTVGAIGAGSHVLCLARANHAAIAHRILVLEGAAEDVGDDLHVPVRVHAEPLARQDEIVVDDAQAAEAHPLRIVVVREAKRVISVQPPVVGVAAFFTLVPEPGTVALLAIACISLLGYAWRRRAAV